jgi:hypothetical protein
MVFIYQEIPSTVGPFVYCLKYLTGISDMLVLLRQTQAASGKELAVTRKTRLAAGYA